MLCHPIPQSYRTTYWYSSFRVMSEAVGQLPILNEHGVSVILQYVLVFLINPIPEILFRVIHFTAGLYLWVVPSWRVWIPPVYSLRYCRWEWFISLDFEWSFISGRRKCRWPMVLVWINRSLRTLRTDFAGTDILFPESLYIPRCPYMPVNWNTLFTV